MKTEFGYLEDGKQASLFTIENAQIMMKVTDYGATLVSLVDKETGIDLVTGFDDVQGYIHQDTHMGGSIGRTANRIGKGTFELDGKTYHLPINNNGNSLHGGEGFDRRMWFGVETEDAVTFRYTSLDGEEGYPGNLFVKVTYRLQDRSLIIVSEGTADAKTLFAYTNHSYFNLDGSGTALNHVVTIPSDRYGLNDVDGMTIDQFDLVEGTPFDFRNGKTVGRDIKMDNQQLKYALGFDHYFPIEGEGMRDMVTVEGQKLTMTMASDFPGFHFYSGNYLNGEVGKGQVVYQANDGLCFEPEYCPNGINYPDILEKPIVNEGETLRHEIRYTIK